MKAPALAWRSLWRHSRRTVFCIAASGLGLFFAIVYVGLTDFMLKDASDGVDRTGLGHLQLSAPGFRDEQEPSKALERPGELVSRLALPPGAKVSVRVVTPGLAATAWGNRGVEVLGVDPAAEALVSASLRDVVAGEPLRADDPRGIVLGRSLAKRLKVDVGGKVRITVQRPDGELGAELFRVRGLFGGLVSSLGDSVVYVTTGAARSLLGLGDQAHAIVVFLPDGRQAAPLAAQLRAALGPAVDVRSLDELLPFWKRIVQLMELFIFAIILIVYLMVGLGILNVMLMSVLERTQEFGVLMALGTRPRQVVAQVLFEGAWIATLAVAVGLALGLAVTAYGEAWGLMDYSKDFGEVYEVSGVAVSMKMRTVCSVPRALEAAALVWVLTALVGVYPAWRVARLEPADALRKG